MEFNQLVLERIVTLFKKQGFEFTNYGKNGFSFKSNLVEAIIGYNKLERSCLFSIGRRNGFLSPINDKVLNEIFNSNLKVDQQIMEVFVNNVSIFLTKEGASLLKGDLNKLDEIKLFVEEESNIYNLQLKQRQNLRAINKAWDNQNYKDFIRLIEEIDKDDLPLSYQSKYKIASKKLKK